MVSVRSRLLRTLVVVGLGAHTVACGGIEPVTSVPAEEELGSDSSALCTDPGVEDFSAELGSLPGDEVRQVSASNVYGSVTCLNTYVVEALETGDKALSVGASWGDVLSVRDSEVACKNAVLEVTVHGAVLLKGWQTIRSKKIVGTWDPFFGCSLSWIPEREVLYVPSSLYKRIRVAARAYFLNGLNPPTYKRVGGYIRVVDPTPVP